MGARGAEDALDGEVAASSIEAALVAADRAHEAPCSWGVEGGKLPAKEDGWASGVKGGTGSPFQGADGRLNPKMSRGRGLGTPSGGGVSRCARG